MKKILFLTLLPILLIAQIQFLPITGDYTTYYSSDSLAYVEIYVSVYQGNLQYDQVDSSNFLYQFQSDAEIFKDDKMIDTFSHNYELTSQDTSKITQHTQIIDIFKTELPYGEYTINLRITDKTSSTSGEYLLDLKTIQPAKSFYFSDIELSSSISRECVEQLMQGS